MKKQIVMIGLGLIFIILVLIPVKMSAVQVIKGDLIIVKEILSCVCPQSSSADCQCVLVPPPVPPGGGGEN